MDTILQKRAPGYWSVTTASSAKARRHEDIGDIRWIDEQGWFLSVTRLPGNCVRTVERNGRRTEERTICDAFITLEEAEIFAQEVLTREIKRLEDKRAKIGQ